jgi:hypothetical protein
MLQVGVGRLQALQGLLVLLLGPVEEGFEDEQVRVVRVHLQAVVNF